MLSGCTAEPSRKYDQTILLVPMGAVSADLLGHLQRELSATMEREVSVGSPIAVPAAAFDPARKQFLGTALLEHLGKYDHGTADRVVGVIDADVYAPRLNFIFGQARKPGRFAVIALPRLRESFRRRTEGSVRFRERVVKVTVHELGHTFGYPHCDSTKCAMHFANSVGDIDRQGTSFCAEEVPPK